MLNSTRFFLVIIFAFIIDIACERPAQQTVVVNQAGTAEDVLAEVRNGWVSAYNSANAMELISYFAEDAELLNPGEPIIAGKDSILNTIEGWFQGSSQTLQVENVEFIVSGSVAIDKANYIVLDSSGASVGTGKYVMVWHRNAMGAWKIIWDMWSRNESTH